MSAEDYEVFKERERHRKQRRAERLTRADDFGWSRHSDTHWYRMIEGEKLHWWPSANKWMFRGVYYRGGLPKWLGKMVDDGNEKLRSELRDKV